MKKLIWILLSVSLAANFWLLHQPRDYVANSQSVVATSVAAGTTAETGTKAARDAIPVGTTISPDARSVAKQTLHAALVKTLATMPGDDIVQVRDRLREEGTDENLVYGVIDGMLRLRYYRATRNAEVENLRKGWWRGSPTRGADFPTWNKMAMGPLLETAGHDPLDIVDFTSRFDFLPREKATVLAKIAVDYTELRIRVSDQGSAIPQATNLVTTERRKDVVNLLTPEELAEYDLRFSATAEQNARRFARMQVTEQEFRTIEPLLEQLQKETAALSRDQNYGVASRALEQRTFDRFVATMGYDRAVDYLWSGTTITGRNALSAAMTAIPSPAYAGRFLQLAAETGAAAAAIHADVQFSPDGKRAALVALQQATQPKLNEILPPNARVDLDPQAFAWLTGLSKGEYAIMTPRLVGDFVRPPQTVSVTTPVRGAPPPILSVRPAK